MADYSSDEERFAAFVNFFKDAVKFKCEYSKNWDFVAFPSPLSQKIHF